MRVIHLGQLMKMVSLVIGSAEQVHIQQLYLKSFSLLPATVTTATAMPILEAATATIGRRGLSTLTPAASTSTAAMSTCATTAARSGALSVASR